MTIRSKLLFTYSLMLLSLLIPGLVYFWSASQWREAALRLSAIHLQNVQAERLRAGIHEQVERAQDYLGGESGALPEVWQYETTLSLHLAELEATAQGTEERDHIEGLRETLYELTWALKQTLTDSLAQRDPAGSIRARSRLREYAGDASEDVAVLGQYYRAQIDTQIGRAARSGDVAQWATIGVVVVALLQVVTLVVFAQRWFVRPMATVSNATEHISTGDFETRITAHGADEWRGLASSINRMAASLSILEHKLRVQERMATLGEAAAYTAHNIRNPLAAIRMTVQVIQSELSQEKAEVHDSLSEIVETLDRLEVWSKRFLDYSRPLELQWTSTDVLGLVRNTATFVAGKFSGSAVVLEVQSVGESHEMTVDPLLLEQALAAVLTNAMEAGHTRVDVVAHFLRPEDERPMVRIEITDDGPGISDEVRPRLFRAFASDKQGGTGLGLAQAKSIVELHGGTIDLAAHPAGGTSATIQLPDGLAESTPSNMVSG